MRSFDHETSPPFPKNDTDIVKCLKSGKWVAKIQNPISKVWVLLGAYTNPEEAAESCVKKKLEYESNPLQNTTVADYEKSPGVKHTTSGKWAARIKHKGDQVWLGTYSTHKEASEAFRMSKLELQRSGSMQATRANDCNVSRVRKGKRKALNTVSEVSYHHVYQRPSGRWQTEIRHPMRKVRVHLGTFDTAEEAQEAYNKKKSEFDILACDQSKQNWSVEDGSSNSNCRSAEPFVPCDRGLVINLDAEEFDLGVVDSYGRLIGEYSRLDEELLIC